MPCTSEICAAVPDQENLISSLMADTGLSRGVLYPPLEDAQRADLAASLGPKVTLANPLDYHTYIWGDEAAIERTFTAMMQGDSLALGIVVLDFPKVELGGAAEWDQVIRINLEASFRLMRAAARPMMKARGVRIVSITSVVGSTGASIRCPRTVAARSSGYVTP